MIDRPKNREVALGTVTIPEDDVRDVEQQVAAWRMAVRLNPGDYTISTTTNWTYRDTVSYTVPSTIVEASMPSLFAGARIMGAAARDAEYDRQRIGTFHDYVCFMTRDSFAHYVLEGVGPGRGVCRLTNPSFICVREMNEHVGRPLARLRHA